MLPRRRIGFAWLVWLALLLPMAQAAAAWHACAHVAVDPVGDATQKQAPHALHCDLCLAAAAIGGAALPDARPPFPLHAAGHEPPETAVARLGPAFPTPAYLSRAPPPVPR